MSLTEVPGDLRSDPFDVTWKERTAVLLAVYGVTVAGFVSGFALAPAKTGELVGLLVASFFALGKFLPMAAITERGSFSPYELGLAVWLMDTFVVINIVYGLEGLYRIAPLKRGLDRVHVNAQLVLRAYPRLRKAAVVGVTLFVLFPIAGTGAIGGTFLGILLALNRFVVIGAVSLGGILGGLGMAFAAVHFGRAVVALQTAQTHPVVKYTLICAAASVIVGALWWVNRLYKKALEHSTPADS